MKFTMLDDTYSPYATFPEQIWLAKRYGIVCAKKVNTYRVSVAESPTRAKPGMHIFPDIVVTDPTVANIIVLDIMNKLKNVPEEVTMEEMGIRLQLIFSRYARLDTDSPASWHLDDRRLQRLARR